MGDDEAAAVRGTTAGTARDLARDVARERRDCERYLRRQGLPSLVEEHSVGRDVWGRSSPFLLGVLILELLTWFDTEWAWWQNLLALVAPFAIVGAAWVGLNRLRGRPWSTLPQRVGVPELAFFVLAPALVPIVMGVAWRESIGVVVVNLLLLGIVRVVVGLGIATTLWWGTARVGAELGDSLRRLVRLLPLVVIFSIVLFFNADVWQVFDAVSPQANYALGAFFLLVITVLTTAGARRETRVILAEAGRGLPEEATTFSPRQLRNVVATVAMSQLLQVLLVSVLTGAFFVVVGTLAITPEVREVWQVGGGNLWEPLAFLGADLVIDQTLLRVSVALATFSGLYYAMNVQVDAVYRTELVEDLSDRLRRVLEVRARYLALPSPEPAPEPRA